MVKTTALLEMGFNTIPNICNYLYNIVSHPSGTRWSKIRLKGPF